VSGASNGIGSDGRGGSGGEARPGGAAGFDTLPAFYAAFAEAVRAAFAPDDGVRAFEDFGMRFFGGSGAGAGVRVVWPGAPRVPGALPDASWSSASFAGLASAVPAVGLAREQVRRAQRLETAVAALASAQTVQGALLAQAGAEAGRAFAATITGDGAVRDGLRTTFDRWIEHAEAAWLTLAHSAAWCDAQARTVDAAIAVRAVQQEIADDAARLAGLPTLRDVDALHRRLRDVESAANAAPRAQAKRTARRRTRRKPGPAP
jgi:hypothetical protein